MPFVVATTSSCGCNGAGKADWTPLAGKECVILPDNDGPGERYAETVAANLAMLSPPAIAKVVKLEGLPESGDLADWIDARDAHDSNELRRQLETLADRAEVFQSIRTSAQIDRFQPFPTDALPKPIIQFVLATTKSMNCDTSYVVLPLLSALAAAIGNSRCLLIKRGWTAPAILWTICIGESGSGKTPPFRAVLAPLRSLQNHEIKTHSANVDKYERNKLDYEARLLKWKRKPDGDPPAKPQSPPTPRLVVSDATIEALSSVLEDNPRGVLVARDELSGWFGSFDRYSGSKRQSDASHWLSMHNGESLIIDRKTNKRLIVVAHANVSITGGIQPSILARATRGELRESGLLARMLLAWPTSRPKRWTDSDIRPELTASIEHIVDRLRELTPSTDSNGDPEPLCVKMSPAARVAFIEFFQQQADEQVELSGDLASVWAKLEEAAGRLALVHYLVRWAGGEEIDPSVLDEQSMLAGIEMTRWFGMESKRVYSMLDESDEDQARRRLIEWIERKGGSVTAREVQQGHRQFAAAQESESVLEELVKAGCGHWRSTPSGQRGRPTRRFVLFTESTVYNNSLDSEENCNNVDVDSIDAHETQSDDEWGEL